MDNALPAKPKKEMALSVEFWRILFTVFVSLYHFEIFFPKSRLLSSGSSAVEFFYVLAGFLLAISATSRRNRFPAPCSVKDAHLFAVDFVWKKFKAIAPVVVVALLLNCFVYPSFMPMGFMDKLKSFMNSEWEVLMLVGTPFGFNNGMAPIVPLWYLTPLFIVGYVYSYLLNRHYDFSFFIAPVVGVMFYIYFSIHSSLILDHSVAMGGLTAGMVRGISEMSLGIAIYPLYKKLSSMELKKPAIILLSVIEIYAVYRFFALTFFQSADLNNFRRLVYIMIIVLTSFLNKSLVARLLNRKIWKPLGRVTLGMYVCHYNLIMVYMSLLGWAKMKLWASAGMSPTAGALLTFLNNTGGYNDKFKPIGMTVKDAVLYILLVFLVALFIKLVVFIVKTVYTKLKKLYISKEQAKLAAAAEALAAAEAEAQTGAAETAPEDIEESAPTDEEK
jgi:peptidoglycan/LPS O-acetylase OafA/YrhL